MKQSSRSLLNDINFIVLLYSFQNYMHDDYFLIPGSLLC